MHGVPIINICIDIYKSLKYFPTINYNGKHIVFIRTKIQISSCGVVYHRIYQSKLAKCLGPHNIMSM